MSHIEQGQHLLMPLVGIERSGKQQPQKQQSVLLDRVSPAMDEYVIIKPSKWDRINFISKLFFIWVWPLFIKGRRRDLQFVDLYQCNKSDVTEIVTAKLERRWSIELNKAKPSFSRAILRAFALEYISIFSSQFIQECVINIIRPLCLMVIVEYLKDRSSYSLRDVLLATAFFILGSFFYIILNYLNFLSALRIGMRMRVAATALVYKKVMRLSKTAMAKTTVGQMINIASNDTKRFDDMAHCLPAPLLAVIQSTMIVIILWQYIGLATFTALLILVLLIPFQWIMGWLFRVVRRNTAVLTDRRIRIMSEIISGMRVIKMYNWENPFARLIHSVRKEEVGQIKNSSYLKAINLAFYFMSQKLMFFACFITFFYIYGKAKPEVIFMAIAYFNTLRLSATRRCPDAIASLGEAMVTCNRIQQILMLEEIENHSSLDKSKLDDPLIYVNGFKLREMENGKSESKLKAIEVNKVTARWCVDIDSLTLQDVSFHMSAGELLIIIGPVGAGKTSMLMALLGELSPQSGSVVVNGKLSYCPQEPWTFVASIRDNILFGSKFDPIRYHKVIKVCALERDLELFPQGDQTLVGERGILLSGGQRARVNLARAIYHEAGVYLLDDPLSAVDAHVAKHIFEKCIKKYLREKARILVTHQLQYLPYADRILVLKDGKPFAYGPYEELLEKGIDFNNFINNKEAKPAMKEPLRRELIYTRSQSMLSTISTEEAETLYDENQIIVDEQEAATTKTSEKKEKELLESKSSGAVTVKVYWDYIRASRSPGLGVIAFISMIVSQSCLQLSDVWITDWMDKFDDGGTNSTAQSSAGSFGMSNDWFVVIYSCLIAGMFVMSIIRTTSFFLICMRSSINIHNIIFSRILRCPISHFDHNPSGRILNRFSKDTSTLDEQIPSTAYEFQVTLTGFLAILMVNSYANVYLIIPGVAIIPLIVYLRQFYVHSCRDIKRMESIARSPIYTHFTNTITGLTTLRSFGVQSWFLEYYNRAQDTHSGTYFLTIASTRAFGIVVDLVCWLYVIATVAIVFVFPISASYAGLALTTALTLTGQVQWGCRCSADLESYMTSTERMLEYAHLDCEQTDEEKKTKFNLKEKRDWPREGVIDLDRVTLYYDGEESPVLRDISCHIPAGHKVGVVGRTGAGKSSLIAALFRMTRRLEGSIRIDGVDTSDLLLEDLRQSISIIPQEPIVFTDTVRYNLDPFNEHKEDSLLWSVLEEVQLRKTIEELPLGLYALISEGGSNLSVGQRQLICLARAILRDNPILVLDEASAHVDLRTDQLIQKAIRTRFARCTVITVAHRLNTIIDSDAIMVLDAGQLVEFGHPHLLLAQKDGPFRSLVDQTGEKSAKRLAEIAERSFKGQLNRLEEEAEDAET